MAHTASAVSSTPGDRDLDLLAGHVGCAWAAPGARAPDPPVLTPTETHVVAVDARGLTVLARVDAYNPNRFDLAARSMTAYVTLDDGVDLGSVTATRGVTIPALGHAECRRGPVRHLGDDRPRAAARRGRPTRCLRCPDTRGRRTSARYERLREPMPNRSSARSVPSMASRCARPPRRSLRQGARLIARVGTAKPAPLARRNVSHAAHAVPRREHDELARSLWSAP